MIIIEKKINHDNRYFIFRKNGTEIEVEVNNEKVSIVPRKYRYSTKKINKELTSEEYSAVLNFSNSN